MPLARPPIFTYSEPLELDLLPLQSPVAVQAVAFVALHEIVVPSPFATVVGEGVSETDGAAGDTVTVNDLDVDPPGPSQVRV